MLKSKSSKSETYSGPNPLNCKFGVPRTIKSSITTATFTIFPKQTPESWLGPKTDTTDPTSTKESTLTIDNNLNRSACSPHKTHRISNKIKIWPVEKENDKSNFSSHRMTKTTHSQSTKTNKTLKSAFLLS